MLASTRAACVIIGVGVVAGMHVGVLPSLLPGLRESSGMSLFTAGLLVSMFQLAMGLTGVAAGAFAERIGRARLPLIGLAIMLLADCICALADGVPMLFLGRGLGSIAFLCMLIPGPALLLKIVAPSHQRMVLGIYAAYMPVGMGLGLLLSPLVLERLGTAAIWWCSAFLCLLTTLAYRQWVFALVDRDFPATRSSSFLQSMAQLQIAVRATVAHKKPILLAMGFCFYAAQWMTVMNFLPSFYRSQGIALGTAGSLTALAVMVNALGTVAAGIALQRSVGRGTLVCLASAVMFLGAGAVFSWTDGPWLLRYCALLAFSILGGLIPGTLFASTGAYAPNPQAVATTTGLMQQGSAVGQVLAAPAMGALVGYAGSWTWAWALSGAMALVVASVGWRMLRLDR